MSEAATSIICMWTAAAAEGDASRSLRRVEPPSEIQAATYIIRSLGTATLRLLNMTTSQPFIAPISKAAVDVWQCAALGV